MKYLDFSSDLYIMLTVKTYYIYIFFIYINGNLDTAKTAKKKNWRNIIFLKEKKIYKKYQYSLKCEPGIKI